MWGVLVDNKPNHCSYSEPWSFEKSFSVARSWLTTFWELWTKSFLILKSIYMDLHSSHTFKTLINWKIFNTSTFIDCSSQNINMKLSSNYFSTVLWLLLIHLLGVFFEVELNVSFLLFDNFNSSFFIYKDQKTQRQVINLDGDWDLKEVFRRSEKFSEQALFKTIIFKYQSTRDVLWLQ